MKKRFQAVILALGLTDKMKTGGADLTKEDFTKIEAKCQEEFKLSFADVLKKAMEGGDDGEQVPNDPEILALADDQKATLKALFGEETPKGTTAAQAIIDLKATIDEQGRQIKLLGEEGEPQTTKKVKEQVVLFTGGAHTAKHLFGIEAELFAMSKPWNAVAATRQPLEVIAASKGLGSDWDEYEADFKKEVTAYGKSLFGRITNLQASGELANLTMESLNVNGFNGTGWGEQYIQVRQDTIIVMTRQLNTINEIFPTRYGVQNKEAMLNAFFGQFGQSYQGGRIFKGNAAIEPIEARVYDLMFKHKFSNMKDIEKQYIGFMNKESSDPMKWNMIEWMLVQILTVLMNEWNERRIIGTRVEPTIGTAGHYLHGSDGVIRQLLRWAYEEFRLQPVAAYTTYSKTTILTHYKGFVEFAYTKMPSLAGYKLYFNEKHKPWYTAKFREEFGLQQDFAGVKLAVMDYPEIEMIPVPNMGNSCLLILTKAGNIQLLENAAGEMAKIGMQRDMEELMVFSYWKEGVGADAVGKKFANIATLAADDYQNQYVFISDPNYDLAANATTLDATKSLWFRTVANAAAAPVITDITGAKAGVVYRLTCGDVTFASKTAKSGKFSSVNAWIPTAVGDFLEVYLYYNTDDAADVLNNKFIEVARKVTV